MDLSLVPHLDLINELVKRADTLLIFYGKKDEDQKVEKDCPYGGGWYPDIALKTPETQEGNEDIVFGYALMGNYLATYLSKRGLGQEDLAALSALAENELNKIADIDEEKDD